MADKNSETSSKNLESFIINKTSDFVAKVAQKLPHKSGDLLNFLSDFMALGAFLFLSYKRILPADKVFLSLALFFGFLLLCFSGTLLMRVIDKQEKPG